VSRTGRGSICVTNPINSRSSRLFVHSFQINDNFFALSVENESGVAVFTFVIGQISFTYEASVAQGAVVGADVRVEFFVSS
jgi:hypothetical protein